MALGDAEANSFTALKVAIANAPVLRLPDFEKQFVVTTDASDVAVGAILEQNFGSGLQPIAFASRETECYRDTLLSVLKEKCSALYGPWDSGNTTSRDPTQLLYKPIMRP